MRRGAREVRGARCREFRGLRSAVLRQMFLLREAAERQRAARAALMRRAMLKRFASAARQRQAACYSSARFAGSAVRAFAQRPLCRCAITSVDTLSRR